VDALTALRTRRSIRRYTAAPVADATVTECLRAAMSAPSAGNQQPWQFIVIRDRALREAIPTFHPFADMVPNAPVAILVCGDLDRERYAGYWAQDCAAATQNLLLAAHAQGFGAVWVGVYPKEDRVTRLQALLGLPARVIPFALVPIGVPGERLAAVDRFDAARVHQDRWATAKPGRPPSGA
jgi:nitroreductase